MKKMLLLTLVTDIFFLAGCKYGIPQAPRQVLQTFETMFPGAIHVEWDKEFSTYKADFHHEGHEKEAQFEKDGVWMRTKTELSIAESPAPVVEAALAFSEWEIENVFLFEQASGVSAYYRVDYGQDLTPHEKQLHLLPDGTVVTAF